MDKPIADLKGVVVKAFPTKQNENGRWKPANFDIKTESGVVKVKRFPDGVWDKEKGVKITPVPIVMPAWYDKLIATYGDTLYSLVGSTVQVKGEGAINGTTMAIEYTVSGENFFVLDEEAPGSIEEPATPVHKGPVPPPNTAILKPLDPNSREVMIVDQVIFKGAMELRSGGAAVEQAVADAIAVWDGVRARHFVTQEAEIEEDIV